MACTEALRLQAYFDGELDASASADVENHIEGCRDCAALLQSLHAMRNALRAETQYHRASPDLQARIASALDRETGTPAVVRTANRRGRPFWAGALSGAAATALAAVLAVAVFLPPPATPLVDDVMSAHLRSLMAGHLIDVVSTDQHTVKPWFAGHTEVSPPTSDFPKEDFRLIGGRVDYVEGHRAAVLVYRHGAHVINVFAWAKSGEALPNIVARNGYHEVFWQQGDLVFCAVSDTALDELQDLVRLIKDTGAGELRE